MFKNRFIVVLGALSLLVVAVALARSFTSTPTSEELRWPLRPVITPATDANNLSDYYERHPDWVSRDQDGVVPVTGISDSSDYYRRHPKPKVTAGIVPDTSDYFLRHPELRVPAQSKDLTDYFLRRPELNAP